MSAHLVTIEDKDENKIKEIAAVIGWDLAKLKALANQSHLEQLYFNFFEMLLFIYNLFPLSFLSWRDLRKGADTCPMP